MKGVADKGDTVDLQHQRRCLGRWLTEWRTEQVLRAADRFEASDETSAVSMKCVVEKPDRVNLKPGQIWLLPPCACSGDADRPLYVLAAERLGSWNVLVVPFGPFGLPAVPGEWRTGLRPRPLRVLCCWNARIVSLSMLARGWYSGRLTDRVWGKAAEALAHVRTGSRLQVVSSDTFGPQLKHPLDPRHAYLAEEAALLERYVEVADKAMESVATFCYEPQGTPLRLAAEPRSSYGRKVERRSSRRRKT